MSNKVSLIAVVALCAVTNAMAAELWEQETLTGGFWGLNENVAPSGIEVGLGSTNIYQINVDGGTSTHKRQGRHTGSYDLEITADLQQLLGIERATFYVHAEGSWSRTDIDATSIGSAFGVNADAGGRRAMDVTEAWYEHMSSDGSLRVRLGKMDITGGFECRGCPVSFDGSAYANDETGQFLNGALVNNPTIPFPDNGLGLIFYYNPIEWWYASAGTIDAQADARETGFNTAFKQEDYFFFVFETGIAPLLDSPKGPMPGAYRIGFWNDPRPKSNSDNVRNYRDDVGFYLSFDQMLCKENSVPQDTQGAGVFFRYGYANSEKNDITRFWSLGLQFTGLLDSRDGDVLGLGYAKGIFSNNASATYTEDNEDVLEIYYNAQVTPWLNLSPMAQYIADPGGSDAAKDATVFGLRAQWTF
jgi:porin